MSLATLLLAIALVIIVGITLYLWSDNKDLKNDLSSSRMLCSQLNVTYKELKSLFDELDDENVQLTVKCNQYEALLKTRLDDIPVADLSECNYEKCDSGECCKKCVSAECPDRKHAPTEAFSIDCDECMVEDCIAESLMKQDSLKKPCCSCENGVYDPTECIGCTDANGYENYEPIKYE